MLAFFLAAAVAAEITCEMRNLEVRIEYEASGRVVIYDGDEVLAEADGDAMPLDGSTAHCVGDRFRLVRGGNLAMDGDHATLSVGTMEIDMGSLLDTLPPERFDARLAALRRARRAAFRADWVALDTEMAAARPLTEPELASIVEVLLQQSDEASLARAWTMVQQRPGAQRAEVGMTRARRAVDAGQTAEALELLLVLDDVAAACEMAGDLAWMEGKKGKARKQWATCSALSEQGVERCGTICGSAP